MSIIVLSNHTRIEAWVNSKNVGEMFLTSSVLVANPKKLLYTVTNPARGLLNREKKKKKSGGVVVSG